MGWLTAVRCTLLQLSQLPHASLHRAGNLSAEVYSVFASQMVELQIRSHFQSRHHPK